ncbi:MAG TPA: hypothetical protein PLI99_03985, partial [archaeon]|nr:hypothetical protein [archaeon]
MLKEKTRGYFTQKIIEESSKKNLQKNSFTKSFFTKKSIAQGTIEYLVIIAVVVILSLVVVLLLLNQTSSVSETDQRMTNLEWETKEVKIMDFAVSEDGAGKMIVSSNLLNEVIIDSIVVDSIEIPLGDQLFFNKTISFSLNDIPACTTRGNQEYSITINYTTREGLSKKITGVFYANCVSASEVNLGESDSTPPIVSLNSPSEELNSRSVDFNFSVSDESEITSCTLFVGSDSNNYVGINNGVNIINYTFSEDVSTIDWNVICVDANSNSNTVEESLQFSIITTGPSLTIQLNSPQNQSIFYEHELSFQFTPTSSSGEINSCTLRIGDDSNTYTGINSGIENIINYTISDDLGSFEWDINCYNDETWGISDSRNLSMGVNAIQLSTCQQLQEIDTNNETRSKNYVLTQDINCYNDTSEGGALYNSGLGFRPIGTWSTRFTGNFNGGGHTISGLNINRPSID